MADGGRLAFLFWCNGRYKECTSKAAHLWMGLEHSRWGEWNSGSSSSVKGGATSLGQERVWRLVGPSVFSFGEMKVQYISACIHTYMYSLLIEHNHPTRIAELEQLPFFPCKAWVVCSHLQILAFSFPILYCKNFVPEPRNTGLNQFRVSVSSGSSLHYQSWAGSWQEARAAALSALLSIAMSWVSSK